MSHIVGRIASHADAYPDKSALIVDGVSYSYARLLRDVSACDAHDAVIEHDDVYEQLVDWLVGLSRGTRPVIIHPDLSTSHREEIRRRIDEEGEALGDFGVLSSGTTGIPKIFRRREASWYEYFPIQNRVFDLDGDVVVWFHGSLSFTGNLNTLTSVLWAGGTAVTSASDNPRIWMEHCRTMRVSHMYMLPVKLRLFLRSCKDTLPDLRVVFTGSQQLDEKMMKRFRWLQPDTRFILYYGASELNYITYCTYEEWAMHPGTVGRAFPGVGIEVRDDLIYVDTPYGIEGVERPCTVGDEGYFEGEFLMFLGRSSSMVNRGGVKVSIAYVESIIRDIEGVAEAVVVGVKDGLRGEVPAVCAVYEAGASREAVRAEAAKRLTKAEYPRYWLAVDSIPLNASSKPSMTAIESLIRTAKD